LEDACYEVDFNVAKYFLEYKDSYTTLDKNIARFSKYKYSTAPRSGHSKR